MEGGYLGKIKMKMKTVEEEEKRLISWGWQAISNKPWLYTHMQDFITVYSCEILKEKCWDYSGFGKPPVSEKEWKEAAIELANDQEILWS